MVQLAIEIGLDNVRAVIKKGSEYNIVPLGLIGKPYSFPPICIRIGKDYIFGEAAKLNAISRPDETVFLSDYTQKGMIDKNAMIAFIKYVCQRVSSIFKETVNDITFIVSSHINNPHIQRFLDECIRESGYVPIITYDSTLSFVKSNFNVAHGDKICIIDMRDCPSYVAVVSRSPQSYNTLASVELTELSIKDCENIIEEWITAISPTTIENDDNVELTWVQSEICTSLSQYGLTNLMMGNDVIIPLSFSSDNCEIKQTMFQNWLNPKIDNIWRLIQSLFQNIKISTEQVNHVVMLGSLFQSEFICELLKKCFNGYGSNPKFSILSKPSDDWNMCLSSLKTNFQSSDCALKL